MTRSKHYIAKIADNTIAARYASAIEELSIGWKRKPNFELAVNFAITHCENARNYQSWASFKGKLTEIRSKTATWQTANNAARKLASHLRSLGPDLAQTRLQDAATRAGLSQKVSYVDFVNLLIAIADQTLKIQEGVDGYGTGPIIINEVTDKRIAKDVALTIILAHTFRNAAAAKSDQDVSIDAPALISGGEAWGPAATFANAAFEGTSENLEERAEKYLSTHKRRVVYAGWSRIPRPTVSYNSSEKK